MTETCLSYNGVILRNVQTLALEETPVHDESGQQHIYNRVRLKVRGYFTKDNPRANSGRGTQTGIWPNLAGQYAGNGENTPLGADRQFHFLSYYLNEPRRTLRYSVNFNHATAPLLYYVKPASDALAEEVIPPPPVMPEGWVGPQQEQAAEILLNNMNGWFDMHGGPFPKNVSITQIANNTAWCVEFEVEFALAPWCFGSGGYGGPEDVRYGESIHPDKDIEDQINPDRSIRNFEGVHRKLGVISNRWSCVDRLDESSFLVRTYTGTVRLSNPHWNPHDYRVLTLPPLVTGMRRESIEYRASEDGLKLQYTITDKEVTITPPEGCSDIRIRHSEAAVSLGAIVEFNLVVSMKSEKDGSLFDLHRIAAAIIESRLGLRFGQEINFSTQVTRYDVTSEQGSNSDFSLVVTIQGFRQKLNPNQNNPDAGINQQLNAMSNGVFKRQAAVPGSVLHDYYNQLAKGNRENEQPDFEGVIPALSALHAELATRCTTNLGIDSSIKTAEDNGYRTDRVVELQSLSDNYDAVTLFPTLLIEILDSLPDAPDPSYSLSASAGVYTDYRISSRYGSAGLIAQLPVAKTTTTDGNSSNTTNFPTSVFVTIGPVQQTRRVIVEAERTGSQPRLPNPIQEFTVNNSSDETKHKLLSLSVHHENPVPAAAGPQMVFTSRAEYTYGIDKVPASHSLGIPDYMKASETEAVTLSKAAYSKTLADIFSAEWTLNT
jgi:hypothetical protein